MTVNGRVAETPARGQRAEAAGPVDMPGREAARRPRKCRATAALSAPPPFSGIARHEHQRRFHRRAGHRRRAAVPEEMP